MKTVVIVINGIGGCGKSTAVTYCSNWIKNQTASYESHELSVVDWPKEVAKFCGWNGTKESKDRKFLSDIKIALATWDGSHITKVFDKIKELNEKNLNNEINFYFVNSRETYDIETIKNLCSNNGYSFFKLKVNNPNLKEITEVPFILKEIESVNYDYVINNDKLLSDLDLSCQDFVKWLIDKIV